MPKTFDKKTIKDVPIEHHTVLLRADYNVPLNDKGKIADDYRIRQSVPTLEFLLRAGCRVVICSHMGRPDGKPNPRFSLEQVSKRLAKLLGRPVKFVPDCVGDRVRVAVKAQKPGSVILLENLRFYPQEENNDMAFAKKLAESSGATYFVQDGFGVVHRAHASTEAITHCLPSVAGLLLEKEVSTITAAMEKPKRPLVVVLGGAKVSDKITVIERFVEIADQVVIGGAIANTFLKFRGLNIGKSVYEQGQEELIKRIYRRAIKKVGQDKVDSFLLLPRDVALAPKIAPRQKRTIAEINNIDDEYILDLGPQSTDAMLHYVERAGQVIWSGTLGYTEQLMFAYSSAKLVGTLVKNRQRTISIVGGGDTADFVLHWDSGRGKNLSLVSTGGSASLELMAGQKLPGVTALMNA